MNNLRVIGLTVPCTCLTFLVGFLTVEQALGLLELKPPNPSQFQSMTTAPHPRKYVDHEMTWVWEAVDSFLLLTHSHLQPTILGETRLESHVNAWHNCVGSPFHSNGCSCTLCTLSDSIPFDGTYMIVAE